MSATAVITLLTEVIANLPAAITTGRQVIKLVNDSYASLVDAIGDKQVTPEEVNELVKKIVANSAEIQALE
jgi:hypothetical protein